MIIRTVLAYIGLHHLWPIIIRAVLTDKLGPVSLGFGTGFLYVSD